ncbi:MAG: TIR domain-containing protein [Synergistaceae bacterium]|jgi:hypothetical protein|nr:TIR domain-containing protein [Synergistaceae bacterium]
MIETRRRVFFSFHYQATDTWKVQNIRNIGFLERNKPVQPNHWEEIQKKGDGEIKKWIDNEMENCTCVIVFIGEHTAKRKFVQYEIARAWNTGKGLFGIYIRDLKDSNCLKGMIEGKNPFNRFLIKTRDSEYSLETVVSTKRPDPNDARNDIEKHLAQWVEDAISLRAGAKYKDSQCVFTVAHGMFGESMDKIE